MSSIRNWKVFQVVEEFQKNTPLYWAQGNLLMEVGELHKIGRFFSRRKFCMIMMKSLLKIKQIMHSVLKWYEIFILYVYVKDGMKEMVYLLCSSYQDRSFVVITLCLVSQEAEIQKLTRKPLLSLNY